MDRIRNRWLEIGLGLGLAAAIVIGLFLVGASFSGSFGSNVTVSARLSQAGDALEPGDIVTYRDVIIGSVTSASGDVSGGALAKLKITPQQAAQIPATVSAVALPASLFGTTKIALIPPADTSGPRLRTGDVITADTTPAAEGLQTALANAYTLLSSVHPAKLDAALTALATALQGQGQNIGQLVDKADTYLRRLAPHLPQLDDTITSLATVSDEVAHNAPDLVASLGNTLVLAKGILADKQAVATLLAQAPATLNNATALLDHQNVDNAVTIFRNEVPVSTALAANPDALSATITGFKAFADTFSGTLSSGPYIRGTLTLTGVNFADLADVIAGAQGHVFDKAGNPKRYTSADCPRYGTDSGPNCGRRSRAAAALLTTGANYGGTATSIGSPREISIVSHAAKLLTGHGEISAIGRSLTDLLLGPLLRGNVTVFR